MKNVVTIAEQLASLRPPITAPRFEMAITPSRGSVYCVPGSATVNEKKLPAELIVTVFNDEIADFAFTN